MLIKLTIDRIESDKAVLITDSGQTIVWPKDKLPENLHEGSALIFDTQEEKAREKKDKQTAKDILNEIIQIRPWPYRCHKPVLMTLRYYPCKEIW